MTFDQLLIAFRRLRTEVEDIRRRLRAPLQQASSGVAHGNTTSPTTVGSSSEGSETADSTSWTWTSGGTPLELWVTTRLTFNESGDQKLYAYQRKLTVDTEGFVYSVSGETRYIIDTPT